MSVRIVVTGSECTGKTTLARALAERFGVKPVPEFLRKYFEAVGGVLTLEDAIPIAKGQLKAEKQAEAAGINPLICDTNLLSSVIYNRHYYGTCPKWIEQQLTARHYHHYFLCGTDVPWQADGQRDRPEQRAELQNHFREELLRRKVPFTELKGDVEQRLETAAEVVQELLEATS